MTLDILFGALAPSTKLASAMLGVNLGFQAGSLFINSFEQGSALGQQRDLIKKQELLFKAKQSLKTDAFNLALEDIVTSSQRSAASVVNAMAQAGVNTNVGTAADTIQKTRAMSVRHALLSTMSV